MTYVHRKNAGLLTDLYELTMAASYHARGLNPWATFDLFVRDLPQERNFLVACGLEEALDYLEDLSFDQASIEYLDSLGIFKSDFLHYLSRMTFSGEVCAIEEGEVVFAAEPIVRVSGPLIEAQIVETFLLNCITYQTMVASKAARIALACGEKRFVDFSPRRDHGADAALKAARASFAAGAAATSNVLAGRIYGIPVTGTMAHSYVMAFEGETEAFRAFARDFPDRAVLLIDTFDVEEGARRAAGVAKELESEGVRLVGVRIDSGDLAALSRSVRKILDEAGLEQVGIVLSGDLDEYRIRDLLQDNAPADSFGVGTRLGTSEDAPYLGTVYKLVVQDGLPKIKLSTGKVTLPGVKQVYRFEGGGHYSRDVIGLEDEYVSGRPLLKQAMVDGRRTSPPQSLEVIKERARVAMTLLPKSLRALEGAEERYPVQLSPKLGQLVAQIRAQVL